VVDMSLLEGPPSELELQATRDIAVSTPAARKTANVTLGKHRMTFMIANGAPTCTEFR